jgi:uncharacterized protein (DUF2252 family)
MPRSDTIPSPKARRALGRSLRKKTPRSAHAAWQPAPDRPNPVDLINASNRGRVASLVPIRTQRMLQSPFAFLRGAAMVMAADLARTPKTGSLVQAGGDSHLANFGAYLTPDGSLVFDVDDFDETLRSPWEWDVKRLGASVAVAARHIGLGDKAASRSAAAAAGAYRSHMADCADMSALQVWNSRVRAELLERAAQRARSERSTIERLTKRAGDSRRIVDAPPLLYHDRATRGYLSGIREIFLRYRETLRPDVRVLIDRYRFVDAAVKVVGVGSVGTRCALALLLASPEDGLLLQVKEARASVLEPYAKTGRYANQGERVVAGQRLMQARPDIFLGWTQDEGGRDYYVRHFREVKASADVDTMDAEDLMAYAALCGRTLARAHARSGDPCVIAGYLGSGGVFDRAIATFALRYADQTERDFEAFKKRSRARTRPSG